MFVVWILIILGVVALDQVSKILVVEFLDRDNPFVIIEGVFRLKYSENRGAAFGSFDESRWVFMIASVIGIVALSVYLFKFRPKSKFACTALSMIIGGGIGNMIDRCFRTGEIYEGEKIVVDFFDFYAFPDIWNAIFNVADSFVCIGAGMLILWCIVSMVQEIKAERAAKAAALLPEETAEELEEPKADEIAEPKADEPTAPKDNSDGEKGDGTQE